MNQIPSIGLRADSLRRDFAEFDDAVRQYQAYRHERNSHGERPLNFFAWLGSNPMPGDRKVRIIRLFRGGSLLEK